MSFNNNNNNNNQFVTVFVPVQISITMFEKMNINSFCKTNDNQTFPILTATELFNEINKSHSTTTSATASMRTNDSICCTALPVIQNKHFESHNSTFNEAEEQSCFASAREENNGEILHHNGAVAFEQKETISHDAAFQEFVKICFRRVRERENHFVKAVESCVFALLQGNVAFNQVNFNNGFGWDNDKNCFDCRPINNEGCFGATNNNESVSRSSWFMRSIITSSIISIYEKAFIISMQSLFSCLLQVVLFKLLSASTTTATTSTTTTTTNGSSLQHHGYSYYEKKGSYSTCLKQLNMYHLQLKQCKPQKQQPQPHPQQQQQQQPNQQQQQFITVF